MGKSFIWAENFFGPKWLRNITVLTAITFAPATILWLGGEIVLDYAKFAEEWTKIFVTGFFVYFVINLIAGRQSQELKVIDRMRIINTCFINPLEQFEQAVKLASVELANGSKTDSKIADTLEHTWDLFYSQIEYFKSGQSQDAHFFKSVIDGPLYREVNALGMVIRELSKLPHRVTQKTIDDTLANIVALKKIILDTLQRVREY